MQFAKLSPDGHWWVAEDGFGTIVRGLWGSRTGVLCGYGISPGWLGDRVIGWVQDDLVWRLDIDPRQSPQPPTVLQRLDRPLNGFVANRSGGWAAWSGETVWFENAWIAGASQPAVSVDGSLAVVRSNSDLEVNGEVFGQNARLPRFAPNGEAVWIEQHTGLHVAPPYWAPWQTDAHTAIPVSTRSGAWLVTQTDTRLIAHSQGSSFGQIVRDVPDTFRPDAVGVNDVIRVVYDNAEGLHFKEVDITQSQVNLAAETWEQADPIVDVWPYLVGLDSWWPRTGSHRMDRVWVQHDQRRVSAYFVKFGDATKWERWALTGDGYIRHIEDHPMVEDGESYQFEDGRWLRARMRVGETIDCSANRLRWWRQGRWTPWERFPYRMTLDAHEREVATGRLRIRFTYDPGGTHDTLERYTCELGLGWVEWVNVDQTTNTAGQPSVFRDLLAAEPIWPSAGHVIYPPIPTPGPEPMPIPPYRGSPEQEKWLGDQFKQDYDEAGRGADYDTITWGARTYWDYCNGLPFEVSVKKHRNECRAGLGLAPLP